MSKSNIIIVLITILLVGSIVTGVKIYKANNAPTDIADQTSSSTSSNVKIINGKQQITIIASQGYSPRMTTAKA